MGPASTGSPGWRTRKRGQARLLTEGPSRHPPSHAPQADAELEELRTSLWRGRPFGKDVWRHETVRTLGLEVSLRDGGRPRKSGAAGL